MHCGHPQGWFKTKEELVSASKILEQTHLFVGEQKMYVQ